ncbi:hypothetical protein Desti_0138 [Desulfomonile tiedjei DSM 6799]|uniref:Uncharacterized protein n=1 Tax=Desulfomonile tiedjei (strain ATCC 49306 / DSM 6799 / DCB-1) TaxID=706587 RepID=I4BZZ3_DESTA|nr:hypothetical protein Desti_0138 [Desulfomonile tiedjei DSM 6799]
MKPALAGLRSEVSHARRGVRSGGDLPGPAMNKLLDVTRMKAHWYHILEREMSQKVPRMDTSPDFTNS